jgi:sarcosine/dimethylglycine N-methyltransferase
MNKAVDKARSYYDSEDADRFYELVWGGEDIHIGLYEPENISVREASRRTVMRMADMVSEHLRPGVPVLDLGAGYGGAARFLASQFGVQVVCLNLSEVENQKNLEKNQRAGLDDRIRVVTGNFEDLDFPDHSFPLVWSEDAILHSGEKEKVFSEVARVLQKGGSFVFTDPMQVDDCPPGVLEPIYDRIHLNSMGSLGSYDSILSQLGLRQEKVLDFTPFLVLHYSRVRDEILGRRDFLCQHISEAFLDRMVEGLGHWIEGGKRGFLFWGILHYRRIR